MNLTLTKTHKKWMIYIGGSLVAAVVLVAILILVNTLRVTNTTYVDRLTGCEYLVFAQGGATVRVGPDGKPLCG